MNGTNGVHDGLIERYMNLHDGAIERYTFMHDRSIERYINSPTGFVGQPLLISQPDEIPDIWVCASWLKSHTPRFSNFVILNSASSIFALRLYCMILYSLGGATCEKFKPSGVWGPPVRWPKGVGYLSVTRNNSAQRHAIIASLARTFMRPNSTNS